MMETWRDIEGYEGLYQISNKGRVKSTERIKWSGNVYYKAPERILKACKRVSNGYLFVNLYKDGKRKPCTIHRLVAEAFLPNPDNLPQVNHKDENKENNCISNLEWCSPKYNCNYGTKNQRSAEKRRNDPSMSRPVMSINKESGLTMEYPSLKEAERLTGVSTRNIVNCCKGRCKSAGGYFWQYIE